MKKAFTVAIIAFSSIYLTGCDEKFTKEWYVSHHKEMIEKYTECLLNNSNFGSIECKNARDALHQEKHKPDVKEGYKNALMKLHEKTSKIPVTDLNNIGGTKK